MLSDMSTRMRARWPGTGFAGALAAFFHPMSRNSGRSWLGAGIGLLAALLGGCAIVPGMTVTGMGGESVNELPVEDNGQQIPGKVPVQPITAELIIRKREEMTPPLRPAGYEPIGWPDYLVGPGDILSVIVWDHPELTIPFGSFRSAEQAGTVVNEDGTIFFPYAGVVKVAGLSLRQIRELLHKKLSQYIEELKIDVRIAAFRSKRVYVVGEVSAPGIQHINDIPMTIVEAVNRAGGFADDADRQHITLSRRGTTYRINLLALYENGEAGQNILLEPGDVVNVPNRRERNKVFVIGEVNNPGSYLMEKGRKSLAEALADAGDLDQSQSDPRHILVLRPSTPTPEIYHLNAKAPDALILADRFPLQPRDVVYVEPAAVVQWNRVFTNLRSTTGVLRDLNTLDWDWPGVTGRN